MVRMKFCEEKIDQGYFISSYDEGGISVNGIVLTSSFVISHEKLVEDWAPDSIASLCDDHLEPLIALEPELVLIGTGSTLTFPDIENYARLIQHNIGVEIMDSGAACRTYNILLGEGRKVAAGIIF